MSIPEGAPAWFVELFTEFTKGELEPRLGELVKAWAELENLYGFEDERSGYKTTSRPVEVGIWIKNGRTRGGNERPPIASLKSFATDWWAWWQAQQPPWREMGGMVKYQWAQTEYGDEWTTLRFPGKNGVASFVATLIWWRQDLQEAEKSRNVATSYMWDMALRDVLWMTKGLIEHERSKDGGDVV
ncbi:hypothetical protein C8J56DRAFT_787949 [Mycena floridula]|nr:hypothetical protein C8J56DRAFT_787949 [Mycena floridula]